MKHVVRIDEPFHQDIGLAFPDEGYCACGGIFSVHADNFCKSFSLSTFGGVERTLVASADDSHTLANALLTKVGCQLVEVSYAFHVFQVCLIVVSPAKLHLPFEKYKKRKVPF